MKSDTSPTSLKNLTEALNKLPGIGPKSAQRIAHHIIRLSDEETEELAQTIATAKENTATCSQCHNLAETDPCAICEDDRRDQSVICIVEQPIDVTMLEKTRSYTGLYHVLHGALSPVNGVSPSHIKLAELHSRLSNDEVVEAVLATNPDTEGETTASYILNNMGRKGLKITRLARGLSIGSSLENTDQTTLGRAMQGRQEVAP